MSEAYSQLRILRMFDQDAEALGKKLCELTERSRDLHFQLAQRYGELAVCIRTRGERAAQLCAEADQALRQFCGAKIFGTGATGLPQAAVASLHLNEHLMVAADQATGQLLSTALEQVDGSRRVFDFGTQSYAHPDSARRLSEVPQWLQNVWEPAPRMEVCCRQALKLSGADYALALVPAQDDQCAWAMLCSSRYCWMQPIAPDAPQAYAVNWLLELVRRVSAGLEMPRSAGIFRPGKLELGMHALQEAEDCDARVREAARVLYSTPPPVRPALPRSREPGIVMQVTLCVLLTILTSALALLGLYMLENRPALPAPEQTVLQSGELLPGPGMPEEG